jgi:hypothetical protein
MPLEPSRAKLAACALAVLAVLAGLRRACRRGEAPPPLLRTQRRALTQADSTSNMRLLLRDIEAPGMLLEDSSRDYIPRQTDYQGCLDLPDYNLVLKVLQGSTYDGYLRLSFSVKDRGRLGKAPLLIAFRGEQVLRVTVNG